MFCAFGFLELKLISVKGNGVDKWTFFRPNFVLILVKQTICSCLVKSKKIEKGNNSRLMISC
jgi:hypothetical protein